MVEIRAKLESMSLDDVDNLTAEDAAKLSPSEPDPIDEEPSSTQTKPARQRKTLTATAAVSNVDKPSSPEDAPFGMPLPSSTNSAEQDAALFGTIWPLGDAVKLDTTVDRQRLRQQCTRLGELGYVLDFKLQVWTLSII